MLNHDPHISLADLSAVGVRARPTEAVTLVRELVRQVMRDELPGVPSAHVIRLARDGRLFIEGPVAADDGRAVVRAAHLLDVVLPGFDAPPELRAPGALRLVVARALGTLDLPPYRALDQFVAALDRFAMPDAEAVVRALYSAWATAVELTQGIGSPIPAATAAVAEPLADAEVGRGTALLPDAAVAAAEDLSVSDIRRARRATGLTLGEISNRSRIPVWLLRELEWGYLRNWPAGHYGRTQLTRYARAAGLDEGVVVSTVWPMLESDATGSADVFDAPEVTVSTPPDDLPLTMVPVFAMPQEREKPSRRRWLAALAIPALVAIGVAPAVWSRATANDETVAPTVTTAPAVATRANETPRVAPKVVPPAPASTHPAAARPPAATPPPAHAAAAATRGAAEPQRDIPEHPAYSPAFATVGSAMFYHTEANGRSALMRADTDSRGAVLRITSVVDDRAQNFHARPSPDGTQIAFDSDRDGERAVYIADSNGHNVRRVSGGGFAAIPSWSPDGQSLAFVRAEPGKPRVWNLWMTDLETGAERRLTSYQYGQPWGGSWFPDGKRIAYSHESNLVILDLASGKRRVFNAPIKGRLVRTPAVSPDGRRVIFQVSRDGTWLLDVADGSMRKVLSDPSAEEYTWAPDGRRVAYHSRRTGDWGVWVMAAQ